MATITSDPGAARLSTHERRTLDEVFRHPAPHNLEWRDVVRLVSAVGSVEERRNNEFVFTAAAQTLHTRKPHTKDLTQADVTALGHFLTRAGLSALDSVLAAPAEAPSLIVVVDHAEARIYHIDVSSGDTARHKIAPWGEHHFLHPLARTDHRLGADDYAFLEQIAGAVASGGRIVVIGHGAGESNMADQLGAYLKTRHNETFRRIVRTVVADIPNLTAPQLLTIGAHALSA